MAKNKGKSVIGMILIILGFFIFIFSLFLPHNYVIYSCLLASVIVIAGVYISVKAVW